MLNFFDLLFDLFKFGNFRAFKMNKTLRVAVLSHNISAIVSRNFSVVIHIFHCCYFGNGIKNLKEIESDLI